MRKLLITIAVFLWILVPSVALAYSWYIDYSVVETAGTSYTALGLYGSANNSYYVSAGYISASGLNSRVYAADGTVIPHMLTTNATWFVTDVPASSSQTVRYTMGETPLTAFNIILGTGGYATIPYNPVLAPTTNDFSINWTGYFYGTNNSTLWAQGSNGTSIVVSGTNITATVYAYNLTSYTINENSHGALKRDSVPETYNQTWTAANGTSIYGNATTMYRAGGSWIITRPYLRFDTSGIIDPIYSASLWIYNGGSNVNNACDYVIQTGNNTYPHNPAVLADYDKSNYSGNGGSVSGTWFATHTSANITLNASGLSMINLGGMTTLVLRNSNDIAGSAVALDDMEMDGSSLDKLYLTTMSGLTAYTLNAAKPFGSANITLSLSTGTLGLYVNGVLKDSVGLTGKYVYDNTDNVVILQSGAAAYTSLLSYSLGGIEQIKYQPNAIISGTTLPDRMSTQDAIITWGGYPVGLAVTPVTYGPGPGGPSPAPPYIPPGNPPPEVPLPGGWYGGLSAWGALGVIGFGFGTFLLVVMFTRSALLAYIAMVVVFSFGVSLNMISGWVVFAMIIVGLGIMYLYRQVAY